MDNKSNIFEKFKYFVGLDDLDEYEEHNEHFEEDDVPEASIKHKNKIVNIHTNSKYKLVIHKPKKFEDCIKIVDSIKNRKPVVLNLLDLDNENKKRVFDFINGALYALEGNINKVAKDVFVIAPSNIEINGKLGEEFKSTGVFPWNK